MRKGINDKILMKITEYQDRTIKKIGEVLNGDQPFASVKVNPDEIIEVTHQLHPLDIQQLVQEFGVDKVEQFRYQVWKLEQRRQKNG